MRTWQLLSEFLLREAERQGEETGPRFTPRARVPFFSWTYMVLPFGEWKLRSMRRGEKTGEDGHFGSFYHEITEGLVIIS